MLKQSFLTFHFYFRIHFLFCVFGLVCYVHPDILRLFECGKVWGTFSVVYPHKSLSGSLLAYYRYISRMDCLSNCIFHIKCQSTNFIQDEKVEDFGWCELNSKNISADPSLLVERRGCLYAETPENEKRVSCIDYFKNLD